MEIHGRCIVGSKWILEPERCKGCGLCTTVCPKEIVYLSDNLNRQGYRTSAITSQEACISCGFCALICPDVAVEVSRPEKSER